MENVHGDCTACKLLVDTFLVGLEKTKKGNFAGGNTDWEEKKLGTYKKSETRFLEIIEFVCKKDSLDDKDTYSHISNIEFKCHTLLENHEEEIEEWFKNDQDKHSDMMKYFCYDKFKLCCPSGYYSSECKPCPGLLSNGKVCYGRGTCNGDGLRKGTGKCSCDEGYAGPYCNNCASQYFEKIKTDSYIECEKCYEGCAKGCKSSGPKGCTACRTGFEMNEELGCIDIDECLDSEKKCTKANQICKNNIGSYNCLCIDGYILNGKTNECEVDINAHPPSGWYRPDTFLKSIALTSFVAILGFVIWQRSLTLAILALIASILIAYIEYNVDIDSIPDEAKKLFNS